MPLSARTGILEWVDDTMPIGEYLLLAHPRIFKGDLTPNDCRKLMNAEHVRKGSTPETKLEKYRQIIERFRPVFQHFFFESFKSPQIWFEKRLAYTKSVAVNSIIGYVVGLGDRQVPFCHNYLAGMHKIS